MTSDALLYTLNVLQLTKKGIEKWLYILNSKELKGT